MKERYNVAPVLAAGCALWALQLVWSTIFVRGTAYLESIGIPISVSAILWIAGPMSGMIIQPIISAMSDSYVPRAGSNKRKPFIVAGTIATIICMLGLAWIPNIVRMMESVFGPDKNGSMLIINAFVWIYGLNIAVQPLQGGVRTLLHEQCPAEGQSQMAAWQSVIIANGVFSGCLLASTSFGRHTTELPAAISSFQDLVIVVSAAVLVCSVVTISYPYKPAGSETYRLTAAGRWSFLSVPNACRRNWECLQSMPKIARIALEVQFFSWMAWFPALYYQTAYLIRIPTRNPTYSASASFPNPDEAAKAASEAMPTAAVMMLTTVFLPACARWSHKSSSGKALARLVDVWLLGLVLFAMLMAATVVASSKPQAILIFALVGVPRALTTWVPFALSGREIAGSRHAGTLNSLHNAAISASQTLAAAMCAFLFMVAKHFHVENETVSAMLLASVASLVAAWRATELRSAILDTGIITEVRST